MSKRPFTFSWLKKSVLHLVLLAISFLWLVPSLGLFISSFRPKDVILKSGWWEVFKPPFQLTLENYSHVITRSGMGTGFINSLIIAIPSTVMPMVVAAFAAYAFSWMQFKGRRLLFFAILFLLVVPLQMTLIPILQLFTRLNLAGSFFGIWLAHTAYGLPFAIYLLRNFIQDLPQEMMESAHLDGASHFHIFFRLVLPTSLPAMASLAIYQFLWVWNDLLIALIFLGGDKSVAPMTVAISNLVNSYGGGWQYLTAAASLSMILPLVVFFSMQKYFIHGILTGSVKE